MRRRARIFLPAELNFRATYGTYRTYVTYGTPRGGISSGGGISGGSGGAVTWAIGSINPTLRLTLSAPRRLAVRFAPAPILRLELLVLLPDRYSIADLGGRLYDRYLD